MLKKVVCLAAVCVTLSVTGSAGAQVGQGNVLVEEWFTASTGQQVGSDVTSLHAYIDSGKAPSKSYWAKKLDRPDGGEDYWGGRMRGYLIPPETGDYTFWTASDDDSEVWLSTDENPANAKMICNVEGWMNYQDWTYKSGSPGTTYKSAPVKLEAGKRYYVDVFFSDGTGGGFDTVAWGGPASIGAGPVVVDGKYLAAFIRDPEPLFKAQNPDPANGATDVTSPLFQWTAGATAVMHEVFMGTSPELGAADDRGPAPVTMYFHVPGLTPGVKYYWRVDETDAAGAKTVGDVWSFTAMPLTAHTPTPADKATDVKTAGSLKWTAGQGAVGNIVFLSADKAAVETGAPSAQVAAGPDLKYDYTGLTPFTTYYWRVDETGSAGEIVPGPVWSFSTVTFLSMADAPVTLNYNNSAAPFTSQVTLTGAADWTAYGLSDLVMQFTGRSGPKGGLAYNEPNQTYRLTGTGTDIWNNGDQFAYAYKTLSGDGTMVARVTNIGTGTNTWAKGGVMIRQSLAAGSTHAYMPITANSDGTAGNGASFQRRLAADGGSSNSDSTTKVAPPYWVKIERKGNAFSGSISPDGQTWTQLGTAQTIAMTDPVYIGLAVTSHDAATMRTFTFDNVSTTGNVTPEGPFSAWDDIGLPSNDPQPLYAAVEDAAGKLAVVNFGDPAATQIAQPWTWKIPLTSFVGVDLKNVAKLYLGAGDLLNPVAGGSGAVTFSSVRIVKPVVIVGGADVTMPGDNVLGVPNNGNWPVAETPWLALDDKTSTKFLHFNGKTEPVGFQVQVMAGSTIVTGLTFTTANDAPERDPVAFELSGSNDGFKGPWTLIAKGDVVDFAGATAWPRYTKNTTPITFENNIAYKFYQVMFTAVRDPKTANSMQIAEVELLAAAQPKVLWVSFHGSDAPSTAAAGVGFTAAPDKGYTDLLKANGYDVVRYVQTGTPDLAVINAADLVIISRSVASSSFQNAAADTWNSVTAPMMILNSYTARKSRMGFNAGSTIPDTTGDIKLTVKDPANPIFAGIALTGDTMTNPFATIAVYPTDGTKAAGLSIVTEAATAGGTVLATVSADSAATGPAGAMVIAEWPAGATVTHDGGTGTNTLGGHRLVFLTGSRENNSKSSETAGMYDLTADGAQMFLNAVAYMLQ